MAAVLLGGVALFGAGLMMKKGSASGDVVTIQADADPARIKPAAQENSGAASGQALFDRKDDNGGGAAKVVSHVEQPADLATAAKQAGAASVATPAVPAAADAQAQGDGELMQPKKVKTVSVRADGSLLNGPAGSAANPAAPPRSALPSMVGGFPAAAPAIPVAKPAVKPAAKPVAKPKPVAAVAPAAPVAHAVEPAAAGGWAVQLAGTPTEAEARAAAGRFAAKYGAALQGHQPAFVAAQVGERTVYRVRVGHLSKDLAESMCNAIKGQGGACFIAKN